VALWPVAGSGSSDQSGNINKIRMVGTLPASSDPVYVQVDCPPNASTQATALLTVCCDHALAVNSIVNQAKRALMG